MALGIIVGGPAGTGKTTVGELLAETLKAPFVEGDQLHPPKNVEKMANGIPLTDDDRWDWLEDVAKNISQRAENGSGLAIGSCSSLTVRYRDYLRKHSSVPLLIVFLHTTKEEMLKRVSGRAGHYMGSNMVDSQYNLMEIPKEDEPGCLPILADSPPEELRDKIVAVLQEQKLLN